MAVLNINGKPHYAKITEFRDKPRPIEPPHTPLLDGFDMYLASAFLAAAAAYGLTHDDSIKYVTVGAACAFMSEHFISRFLYRKFTEERGE